MRLVVADTSPIRYLVLIGQINLLPRLFEKIWLPSVVSTDLSHASAPPAVRAWIQHPPGWLEILIAPDIDDPSLAVLDVGERAAIALGLSLQADLILMDDRKGAAVARNMGFEIAGTLGVIDLAAERAWVDLADALDRLQATNFRYRRDLLDAVFRKHAISIRPATMDEIPLLEALIGESVMKLQHEYTREQRIAALGSVFGVDRQLILDGTYFVAVAGSEIVGCGGWSRRRTPFGGDHSPAKDDALLDPAVDAAKIRAFFIHPAWTRRGIGSRILQACETAAAAAGFTRVELTSTLAGVPLYSARGFTPREEFGVPLSNGDKLPVIRMTKALV